MRRLISALALTMGALAAGCGSGGSNVDQSRPVLTCHEHEVAVWVDYPVRYRCVADDDHTRHQGG